MKRIINLSIIMMLSINLLGQYGGAYDVFSQALPACAMMDTFFRDKIYSDIFDAEKNSRETMFIENNTLFMISYEQLPNNYPTTSLWYNNEKRERNLYLFRLDGNEWNIASDKIQTDYKKCDENGIFSYDYYYPFKDKGGYVKRIDNGNIEIKLTNIYNPNMSNPKSMPQFRNRIFVLKPFGNGTFQVLH